VRVHKCKPKPEQTDPKTDAIAFLFEVRNVSTALKTLVELHGEYRHDVVWLHGVMSGVRTVLEWMSEKSGDAADALSGGDA
jgi:hypothetical protein